MYEECCLSMIQILLLGSNIWLQKVTWLLVVMSIVKCNVLSNSFMSVNMEPTSRSVNNKNRIRRKIKDTHKNIIIMWFT